MKVRSKADIVNKKVLLLGSGELGKESVIEKFAEIKEDLLPHSLVKK